MEGTLARVSEARASTRYAYYVQTVYTKELRLTSGRRGNEKKIRVSTLFFVRFGALVKKISRIRIASFPSTPRSNAANFQFSFSWLWKVKPRRKTRSIGSEMKESDEISRKIDRVRHSRATRDCRILAVKLRRGP